MNQEQGLTLVKGFTGQGVYTPIEGIKLHYPGIGKPGDYRMEENGIAITHAKTARTLYDMIFIDDYNFEVLDSLLEDIILNGTDTIYGNASLEYLKHLIFWETLQEEINFSRVNGNAGIYLAFCRFYEAIYATKPEATFSIGDVQNRCHNHRGPKPRLFDIPDASNYYHY